MLLNLYILIIIISVQTIYSACWRIHQFNPIPDPNFGRDLPVGSVAQRFHPRGRLARNSLKKFKRLDTGSPVSADSNEVRYFENIREFQSTSVKPTTITTKKPTTIVNLVEIKNILSKLLSELDHIEGEKKRQCSEMTTKASATKAQKKITEGGHEKSQAAHGSKEAHEEKSEHGGKFMDLFKGNKDKHKGHHKTKWGDWTDWSACSVSCGRGRQIRWRHCKADCNEIETEMEEKTCQLPACGPGKLFGVISL